MFVIVMMDKGSMANHNPPDTLTAKTRAAAEAAVREHIIAKYWNRNMDLCTVQSLTDEEVRATPMEELEEAFAGEGYDEGFEWSIQEKV